MLDVLHRDRLALRIHEGAFSAMDLTARHPRTGELLSTVKFMVQTLAAAGELQRDFQRELTYDGLRAAEAKGSKGGRRPVVTAAKAAAVRAAYLGGQSIASLARDHHVSRGAIRTAVADLLPEHTTADPVPPAPELPVTLDMPGKVADCTAPAAWFWTCLPRACRPWWSGLSRRRGSGRRSCPGRGSRLTRCSCSPRPRLCAMAFRSPSATRSGLPGGFRGAKRSSSG